MAGDNFGVEVKDLIVPVVGSHSLLKPRKSDDLRANPTITADVATQERVPSGDESWFFDGLGLKISVLPAGQLLTDDYSEERFSNNTLIGRMDFKPNGADSYDPTRITPNLTLGLQELQQFFADCDEGKSIPAYLVGVTNNRMARAVRRLGFEIKPTNDKDKVRVVGETSTIRQKLETILAKTDPKGRRVMDMLHTRLQGS